MIWENGIETFILSYVKRIASPGLMHDIGCSGKEGEGGSGWGTRVHPWRTQKHLSTMWETRVRSLGREDPPEKEMAIHSSTIAWKIPWTEEPDRLQSMGVTKSRTRLSDFTFIFTFTFMAKPKQYCKVIRLQLK